MVYLRIITNCFSPFSSCTPNSFPLSYLLPAILDARMLFWSVWSVAFNFYFFDSSILKNFSFYLIKLNQQFVINYPGLDENSTSYYPLSFCTLLDSLCIYKFVSLLCIFQIAINLIYLSN